MKGRNHLFVYGETDLDKLQSTLELHGDTVSYLKIASSHVDLVDIERVCSLVRGSAISVCVGGGVVEDEADSQYSVIQRLFGDHKKPFQNLAKQGVNAVELPVNVLGNKDMTKLVGDFFEKKLVEVGEKRNCFHSHNSPSAMLEGVRKAQEFGADHVVLEGSFSGDCGIYHGNTLPNVLLVHQLMEEFTDKARCIIEAPSQQSQDVWRSIFGSEAHIGNIHDFGQVNTPVQIDFPTQYWSKLATFRNKLQDLSESQGFSWDDVARNDKLNMDLINIFPDLLALHDAELENYLRNIMRVPSYAREGLPPMLGLMLQMLSGGVSFHHGHIVSSPDSRD